MNNSKRIYRKNKKFRNYEEIIKSVSAHVKRAGTLVNRIWVVAVWFVCAVVSSPGIGQFSFGQLISHSIALLKSVSNYCEKNVH